MSDHLNTLRRRASIVARQWTDEQDRSEWFEEQAEHYAADLDAANDELIEWRERAEAAEAALRAYDMRHPFFE